MILEVQWQAYIFTNFLKFPGESPGQGGSIGGRVGVLGITGPSPSYPSFITLLSTKTIRDHQLKKGEGEGYYT